MANAIIEGRDFSLFYDYDQLRDGKLSLLAKKGKIEWFAARMHKVFLEPVRRIIYPQSAAYLALHSNPAEPDPPRNVAIAAFSIILNGVEACGSFLTSKNSTKRDNFQTFMKSYMKRWDKNVSKTRYQDSNLIEILWKHFRNGIAHQFVIEGGGVEYELKKRWVVRRGMLEVNPRLFFEDLEAGLRKFLRDVKRPGSSENQRFLDRFMNAYPH